MKNINLGSYIKERFTRDGQCTIDPVSGSFDGKFSCNGDFVNLSNFKGVGELSCEKGMYLNPFKCAKVGLFHKRQETRMGFQTLVMDLSIYEHEIFLSRFNLQSKSAEINADGIIDFDGSMNLQGTITAESELFRFNEYFKEIFDLLPVDNVNIPVKFRLTGNPSKYVVETAFSEEIINKYLGDDKARKHAARKLLEKYFGEAAGNFAESIPDINQTNSGTPR